MKTKQNFIVDGAIFLTFLIVSQPSLTGFSLHEWFGAAFFLAIVYHLFLHWEWIIRISREFFRKLFHSSRLNYFMDFLLLVAFVTTMLSGLLISQTILPIFNLQVKQNSIWRLIHNFSADLALFLVALHFALHWKWIINQFRHWVFLPLSNRFYHPALRSASVRIKNDDFVQNKIYESKNKHY